MAGAVRLAQDRVLLFGAELAVVVDQKLRRRRARYGERRIWIEPPVVVAEDRVRGLLIRVARGEQVVEQEPVAVLVIVPVVAETVPPLHAPVPPAVVDQIAGQQDDVGVLLGVVVIPDEAAIPVVVGFRRPSTRIERREVRAPEVLLVDVGAHVDMRVGDVPDLERFGAAAPDEQRMQDLGARAPAHRLGRVGRAQHPIFVLVFLEQAAPERLPECAELAAAPRHEFTQQQRHLVGGRLLLGALVVPEQVVAAVRQTRRGGFADADLVQVRKAGRLQVAVEVADAVREAHRDAVPVPAGAEHDVDAIAVAVLASFGTTSFDSLPSLRTDSSSSAKEPGWRAAMWRRPRCAQGT